MSKITITDGDSTYSMYMINVFLTCNSLEELKSKMGTLKTVYDEYMEFRKELSKVEKQIQEIESKKGNKGLIEVYEEIKGIGYYYVDEDALLAFFDIYPEIKKYDLLKIQKEDINECMRRSLEFLNCDYPEFIVMVENGERYLLDLNNKESFNLSAIDPDLAHFILLSIKEQIIAYITPADLPLIMAIKEDLSSQYEKTIEKYSNGCSYFDDLDNEQKSSIFNIALRYRKVLPLAIGLKYQKARMLDEIDETTALKMSKLPFVYDSEEIQKMWAKFDEKAEYLSNADYWTEYYKLLIIFGNNIEKIYNEAPAENKRYVIDAYHYYSTYNGDDSKAEILTTSPLINEELLKRKYGPKR